MKALQAQDNGSAAKDLYWRMVKLDEMLDPVGGSVPKLLRLGTNQHSVQTPAGPDYDKVLHWGTSEEYVVRRLKRDAPELAVALARGDFPSARAAGIAAGFVKPLPHRFNSKTQLQLLKNY